MLKKYVSKSDIALSVLLETKKSVHVAFSPLTGGGSVLYTADAELQAALEKHPKFGRLFKIAGGQNAVKDVKLKTTPVAPGASFLQTEAAMLADGEVSSASAVAATQAQAHTEPLQSAVASSLRLKQIHVDNLDDAKEYLSDHFGVSRTKLRTRKSIVEAAASNGVEFDGV